MQAINNDNVDSGFKKVMIIILRVCIIASLVILGYILVTNIKNILLLGLLLIGIVIAIYAAIRIAFFLLSALALIAGILVLVSGIGWLVHLV